MPINKCLLSVENRNRYYRGSQRNKEMLKDYKRNEVYIIKHISWKYLMYHAGWHNIKFNSNREFNSSKQLLSAYARCCTKSYTSLILTTTLQDRFYYSHFRDEKQNGQRKLKHLLMEVTVRIQTDIINQVLG